MIIHDAHVHVGQFRDLYSSPDEVFAYLNAFGVDRMAVSSIGTCEGDPEIPIREVGRMVELGGRRILPVLWVNPEWVEGDALQRLLNCGIDWKCLKVHGYFSRWEDCPAQLQTMVDLARKMNVPILFHTGGRPESDAGAYLSIAKRNPEVTFILAHSRPVDQAIHVLENCANVLADTAFTPEEDVAEMIHHGLAERILWGTDYPLHNVFYEGEDIVSHLKARIDAFRNVMSSAEWELVSHGNFERTFS